MTIDEALKILDDLMESEPLNDLQELVFRQCWAGKTYQEIGDSSGYDPDYIRIIGSRLWRTLSGAFAQKITKTNFRSVLRQQARKLKIQTSSEIGVELPGGQVSLDSPFYIERQPIESLCYETISQPGALIRIRSPKQMGKTSLMIRVLELARTRKYSTAILSLRLADATVLSNLKRFLQWFCATISKTLGVANQLANYWDDIFGSNYNSTDYFENYLLSNIESPLVIALDNVDVLFNYPEIATDFFGLLRGWYEKAKYGDRGSIIWQKLRLVLSYSTEVYIPLNINQSPFNVGLSLELPEFTPEQVQDLALRHGLDWSESVGRSKINSLLTLVGGNPYLIGIAFYHLKKQHTSLEQLLQKATREDSIYKEHLRRQLWNLQKAPNLAALYYQVVSSQSPVQFQSIEGYKLESMGLARVQNNQVIPSCNLYREYFRTRLNN